MTLPTDSFAFLEKLAANCKLDTGEKAAGESLEMICRYCDAHAGLMLQVFYDNEGKPQSFETLARYSRNRRFMHRLYLQVDDLSEKIWRQVNTGIIGKYADGLSDLYQRPCLILPVGPGGKPGMIILLSFFNVKELDEVDLDVLKAAVACLEDRNTKA